MSISPEIQPGRGSRRVEAWVYTVINPLIDATRSEGYLLERGTLSWRHYSRHAEYIRVIYQYIAPHNAPNLEDFLADNEQFTQKFDRHDEALQSAEQRAAAFFDAVTSAPAFIREVNDALQQYDSMLNASQSRNPPAASLKDDLHMIVAEYLVNNIESLPNIYTTYRFWQLFREKFQGYKNRESFPALQNAVKELKEVSSGLQHDLENQRLYLCREFGIPAAAPLTSPSLGSDLRFR